MDVWQDVQKHAGFKQVAKCEAISLNGRPSVSLSPVHALGGSFNDNVPAIYGNVIIAAWGIIPTMMKNTTIMQGSKSSACT